MNDSCAALQNDLPPGTLPVRARLSARSRAYSCYSRENLISITSDWRGVLPPALAAAVGVSGAALGLWLSAVQRRARIVIPFSAGVLLGVAAFGLLPELAESAGWRSSLALAFLGYGLLIGIDRYLYPICPTCAHDHDHGACQSELHGLAVPLIVAAALHSFLDGWSVATAQWAAPLGLRITVPLAVSLHKIPEGIALGGIMRAAMGSRAAAFAWCAVAEGTTLVGGAAGVLMAPHLGTAWILYPLGLTAGWILYLGYHAVHSEWKLRGPGPAFVPALTGIAGAAVIQRGAEALFR
jgi:zinc transporter ZupT